MIHSFRERRRFDPVWSGPLLFFTIGMIFAAIPLYNAVTRPNCERNKDYTLWYDMGLSVRDGQNLYDATMAGGEVRYMYPPTLAVLVYTPLSFLGPVGFVAALAAITAAAWAGALWAAMVLITGRWDGQARWLYVVPGLAVSTYVWDIQLLGQINLVLISLVLLSMVALRRERPIAAGALLGLAASMKAFPLTAIVYFIVRREWKATACTLLAIAMYVWFIPGCFRGLERTASELKQWSKWMVVDQSGDTIGGRTSIGFTRRNHSLVSLSHRLLRDVNAGDRYGVYFAVNVVNASPRTAQWIGYGTGLGLGALLLASTRFRFASSPTAEGLEVCMVVCLVVLASPLSFTYFYCWLLAPWTAVLFLWQSREVSPQINRIARAGAIVAAVLLASAVTEQFDPTLQAYGVTTWGTIALFLTLAACRFSLPNAVEEAQTIRFERPALRRAA